MSNNPDNSRFFRSQDLLTVDGAEPLTLVSQDWRGQVLSTLLTSPMRRFSHQTILETVSMLSGFVQLDGAVTSLNSLRRRGIKLPTLTI
jgi:hypothetical protein